MVKVIFIVLRNIIHKQNRNEKRNILERYTSRIRAIVWVITLKLGAAH
jgi:hypothetical protein